MCFIDFVFSLKQTQNINIQPLLFTETERYVLKKLLWQRYDWKGEKQTKINKILNSKFDQRDIRHFSFAGDT